MESASFLEVTNQIEVEGDMIDTVKLTMLLWKIVGPADIISVAKDREKKEDGVKDGVKKKEPMALQHDMTSYSYSYSYPGYSLYEAGSTSQVPYPVYSIM